MPIRARHCEQHAERADLETRLRSWVDAGLLSAEQADAIRRHEAGERTPRRPAEPSRPEAGTAPGPPALTG